MEELITEMWGGEVKHICFSTQAALNIKMCPNATFFFFLFFLLLLSQITIVTYETKYSRQYLQHKNARKVAFIYMQLTKQIQETSKPSQTENNHNRRDQYIDPNLEFFTHGPANFSTFAIIGLTH